MEVPLPSPVRTEAMSSLFSKIFKRHKIIPDHSQMVYFKIMVCYCRNIPKKGKKKLKRREDR